MRMARAIATWFGCGLAPVAPGTFGTLGALPLYLFLRDRGFFVMLLAAGCVAAIGVWAASAVSRETGEKDPPIVVVDEVAGALVAFSTVGKSAALLVLAFVTFRIFDITKIFPARQAERLPSGWGIVADDLIAGAWTAALVAAVRAALAGVEAS
jgi:phosphatidylglycerophosphatase A